MIEITRTMKKIIFTADIKVTLPYIFEEVDESITARFESDINSKNVEDIFPDFDNKIYKNVDMDISWIGSAFEISGNFISANYRLRLICSL